MSNENNDLVIFEYTAFRERLYECADSLPTWASTIHTLLEENNEETLNKLVEELKSDAPPFAKVITAWDETSEHVTKYNNDISQLIQTCEDRRMLVPSEQPSLYLIHAWDTLIATSMRYMDMPGIDISSIQSKLEKGREEVQAELSDTDEQEAYAQKIEERNLQNLQNLQKKFCDELLKNLRKKLRAELNYIAKGDETDNIFREVNKIANDIKPKIVEGLRTIVGNERFLSDLRASMKTLEQDIEGFTFKAQSNINKQINALLDEVEEEFQNILQSEIYAQLQEAIPYMGLFGYTVGTLRKFTEDIKNWQEQTEDLIAESFRLPQDIQDSCERFLEDFKCLEALEKDEQSAEINAEEVEALKHLFGANGTDIFSRVNCKPEDLRIPKNVEKVGTYVDEEINDRYRWENKTIYASSDLIPIFKHAVIRLEDINNYLMEKINE